ncbi:MAG TPA: hypothetical protein VN616_16185 [Puia sp.]|nr:hypothetical protein [Puia sp.]
MKKSSILFGIVFTFFAITSFHRPGDEYVIAAIYKGITPHSDTKAITTDDDLVEIETLLSPTVLKQGRYKVDVTREADDLYHISGTEIYLETRNCPELAISEEVIVSIESNYSYDKGKITFNL